jgi:Acyl-CoA carboxylase epsilon subunit
MSPDDADRDSDPEQRPHLRVVKGDASPEEVAAVVAVLHVIGAAIAAPASSAPRSEWSAQHRKTRATFPAGPGGWRSSSLPR